MLAVSSTRRGFAYTKELVYNLHWFPDIQERNVSTGRVELVQCEVLLEPEGISLEFYLALGFCKRVLEKSTYMSYEQL